MSMMLGGAFVRGILRMFIASIFLLASCSQMESPYYKDKVIKPHATTCELRYESPSISIEGGKYSVRLGPIGKRIVDERLPRDMEMLKKCLLHTDGARTIDVGRWGLPLRQCDYALMIAERISGEYGVLHSFNPWTCYERRDAARQKVMKELYKTEVCVGATQYTYLKNGLDVSEAFRSGADWP